MSKRHSTKYKIDRRMGENIWGRPKSPVNRREYGPGQHGQGRKGKLSDFGIQLRAKQKLKGYYGDLTEKQFRRIYAEAVRVAGDTGENLGKVLVGAHNVIEGESDEEQEILMKRIIVVSFKRSSSACAACSHQICM